MDPKLLTKYHAAQRPPVFLQSPQQYEVKEPWYTTAFDYLCTGVIMASIGAALYVVFFGGIV